jgi:hypothetical protein
MTSAVGLEAAVEIANELANHRQPETSAFPRCFRRVEGFAGSRKNIGRYTGANMRSLTWSAVRPIHCAGRNEHIFGLIEPGPGRHGEVMNTPRSRSSFSWQSRAEEDCYPR